MKRIIDIDEDYFELIKHDVKNNGLDYKPLFLIANSVPYEERPQGEWNYIQAGMVVCPFCGVSPHKDYKNFCPNCGARMQ